MKEKFDLILEKDEEILNIYTPVKKKVYFLNVTMTTLLCLFVCGLTALALFVPEEGYEPAKPIMAIIPVGLFILGELLSLFLVSRWLKNTVYAITNNRILIRTGIIGVDFKSLDLSSIGATNVLVGFIDKILGGKTGTIKFGNMSSPINGANGSNFTFSNISAPYETYKHIKELIGQAKNK